MNEGDPTMSTRQPSAGKKRTVPWRPAAGPLVVVLVVVVGWLAACGGSPSKGDASRGSTTTTNPGSAAVSYAHCMRSNGVTNYPDPGSNGLPQSLSHIDLNSPTFQKAYSACRKYAPNGKGGPPAPTEAQLRAALAIAQCMRKHGFPQFPDPLATAPDPGQLTLTLGQGMYFPVNGTFQATSPAFTRAAKACGVQQL